MGGGYINDEAKKKPESVWSKLISELLALIPKDMRDMIGLQVGVYLFILTPMLIIGGAVALMKTFQDKKPQEKPCWQIQQIDGRIYKLNACTGETIEIASNPTGTKK